MPGKTEHGHAIAYINVFTLIKPKHSNIKLV